MNNIWNTQIPIRLTLEELEDITLALRIVNTALSGDSRSELEEKLSDIESRVKMSV